MIEFCGFADEAASDLAGQIRATKALGWRWIEARNVDGVNLHDLDDAAFDRVCGQLADSGVGIACFGSAIANWATSILDGSDKTLAQTDRAVRRMQRLGTRLIRIMSFQVIKDSHGQALGPDNQQFAERAKRLREITARFRDAGVTPVHENCMNYGGMSATCTLRLLDAVPGLKLVFDTGNPVFSDDHDQLPDVQGRLPKQSSWEFWRQICDHVAHLHIKDAIWDPATATLTHTHAGDGQGDVIRIVADALARGYQGLISIEPHLTVVHHDTSITATEAQKFANYVDYGHRVRALVCGIQAGLERSVIATGAVVTH